MKYIRDKCWQDTKYVKFDVADYFEKKFLEQVRDNLYVLAEVEPKDSRFFIALLQTKAKVASTGFTDKDF